MSNDAWAFGEIASISDMRGPHTIVHYIYVANSKAANEVAQELNQRGFQTEDRVAADGVNWLVLARHEAVMTEGLMTSIRRSLETLVEKGGGEYDGWEVVLSPAPTPA